MWQWSERAPRANSTWYPAVCNDGNKTLLVIGGYRTIVEKHDIETNTWDLMPSLNVKRNAASACVLNHIAYVFCGAGDDGNLNSIEKLDLEKCAAGHDPDYSWQLFTPELPEFSPRYYPAVAALNNREIVILAGYDGDYKNDVFLYDTETHGVTKVAGGDAEDVTFYPNTNQLALVADDTVVGLVGGDGNAKPYLIKWKKGDERIEVIRDYRTLSASTFAIDA